MLQRVRWIGIAVLAAGVLTLPILAQGFQNHLAHGQQGTMPHAGAGQGPAAAASHLDLSNKVAFEGLVQSVAMERGQGSPSFVMLADGKRVTIVTAPYRLLIDADYKISVGDKMNVLAYAFLQTADTYAAAELKNLTSGKVLTLRGDDGVPLMRQRHNCADCPLHTPTAPGN